MNDTECLAATGADFGPALLLAGLLTLCGLLLLASGRTRGGARALGILVLVCALGAGTTVAPPAAYAGGCDTGAATPQATLTPDPTPSPSTTPTPSITPTPTPTAAAGAITGTYTRLGERIVVTSPPGDYDEDPGTTWNLPTIEPVSGAVGGAVMELTGAGADGAFGTADDTRSSTPTASDGTFAFTGLPPGEYRVTTSTLPTPDLESPAQNWQWASCSYSVSATAWSITTPLARDYTVAVAAATVSGIDFVATNQASASSACS